MRILVSFLLVSGVEVQTHDLKGKSLLIKLVSLLKFGLMDHLTQRALLPFLIVPLLPMLLCLLQWFFEVFLIFGVVELIGEVSWVGISQVSVHYLDVARANHHLQVLSQLCKINNGPWKCGQNGFSDIFIERAWCSNRNWVAEDHIEALLVDWMLTLGFDDFFLSGVSQQNILQFFIRNKARANRVVVHTLFALIREIFGDIEVGMLCGFDEICVYFEGKGSEVAVVYSAAVNNLLPDVLSESLDDKMELGLWIQGLHRFAGPGLGGLMLSGVILCVANDPTLQRAYQV